VLGVKGCNATRASSGNRLTVGRVDYIAAGEDAFDGGF
jgi:hypothetical protein